MLNLKNLDWVKSKIDLEKCEIYSLGVLFQRAGLIKNPIFDKMIENMTKGDPNERFSKEELRTYCEKFLEEEKNNVKKGFEKNNIIFIPKHLFL